jgi:hypothetical protein
MDDPTVVVVAPSSTEGEAATKEALAEHAAEDKQEVAEAKAEAKTDLQMHEEAEPARVREIVMQCLRDHHLDEWSETLDECGRHMMSLEANGGEAASPNEETKTSSVMVEESSKVIAPESVLASPSGSVAPSGSATEAVVVAVETPVPVSAQTVAAEQKPRGFLGTLIFGRAK